MPKIVKELLIIGIGIVALVYLINPTAGIIELIPDNFPIIGNLDEGAATAVVLAVLRHYGLDIVGLLSFRD
jgi:uncharacterized membrane protein YkvA (DUF1232 family)